MAQSYSVLIVEDEAHVGDRYVSWLKELSSLGINFEIDQQCDLEGAMKAIKAKVYDLIFLDVQLGLDDTAGHKIAAEVRQCHQGAVIFCSGVMDDRLIRVLRSLEQWEDGWTALKKPFEREEFLDSTKHVLLERQKGGYSTQRPREGLVIDLATGAPPTFNGERIDLSPTSQRIALHLFQKKGSPVRFEDLYQYIKSGKNKANVRVNISKIKQSIKSIDEEFDQIQSFSGGYIWL